MIKLRSLACSFCGKKESEVLKLVAGPRVYICDECVAVATVLMNDPDNAGRPLTTTVWQRLSAQLRELFHRTARGGDYFSAT